VDWSPPDMRDGGGRKASLEWLASQTVEGRWEFLVVMGVTDWISFRIESKREAQKRECWRVVTTFSSSFSSGGGLEVSSCFGLEVS